MLQPWFVEAKFGVFIHWGIYSVAGVEASWAFRNFDTPEGKRHPEKHLSYDRYLALAKDFTARNYQPREWARFFKSLGARYAVLTAKHHDGVALWPTQAGGLSIATLAAEAPADLVGPFCDALRAEGLRVGLYFSHADWSHPDYAAPDDPRRWQNFLAFHRAQIRELCERYRPDLLWFDGEHERTPQQWRFDELKADMARWLPGVVINNRFTGLQKNLGDYATPEQVLPLCPQPRPWEFCATINHQWGYSPDHSELKPAHHLTRMLFETASLGGNLLLNIGPREDGTFDEHQRARLQQLGDWLQQNRDALFGTLPGLPPAHSAAPSTLSQDRRTIYLCLFDQPPHNDFPLKGLRNKIQKIHRLDTSATLAHHADPGAPWHNIPGTKWIHLDAAIHPLGTIVAIHLESALDLWPG